MRSKPNLDDATRTRIRLSLRRSLRRRNSCTPRYRAAQLSPSSLPATYACVPKKWPGDDLKASEQEKIKRVDAFLGEVLRSTASRELQENVVPNASLPASPETPLFVTPGVATNDCSMALLPEVSTATQNGPPLPDFLTQKFAIRPGIAPLPKTLSPHVLPINMLPCYTLFSYSPTQIYS